MQTEVKFTPIATIAGCKGDHWYFLESKYFLVDIIIVIETSCICYSYKLSLCLLAKQTYIDKQ